MDGSLVLLVEQQPRVCLAGSNPGTAGHHERAEYQDRSRCCAKFDDVHEVTFESFVEACMVKGMRATRTGDAIGIE